jgi:1-acyl-sn-glycerol-3-phosphate acyltransferase
MGLASRDEFRDYLPGWGRAMVRWSGVVLKVTPAHPTPATGARLVVSNHRSPVDIPILVSLFGGYVVSRADVAGWPLIGAAAARAGTLFVDRESRSSGARTIRAVRRKLVEGATVLVFPEGTTRAGDEVAPFRAGTFRAVEDLDVEVCPVGLAYPSGREWFGGTFGAHMATIAARPETRVVVRIGRPLRSYGSARDLAGRAHQAVQMLTREARTELERWGDRSTVR